MLPRRTAQRVAEEQSLLILREVLPKHWIFRHVTVDDYGIDLEIELVEKDGRLPGVFFKAQVKSRANVRPRRQDGWVTVSGYGIAAHKRFLHGLPKYCDLFMDCNSPDPGCQWPIKNSPPLLATRKSSFLATKSRQLDSGSCLDSSFPSIGLGCTKRLRTR